MDQQENHDLFTRLITRHQSDLYAYIFAIVRDWDDANDLFQSVCLVLWRKFDTFQPGSNFFLWARQTAKLEVRHFLSRKKPLNPINEELLDALTKTTLGTQSDESELYLNALRACRSKLGNADAELLQLRYIEDLSSGQIADRLQRPQPSICNSLFRIRRKLLECIEVEVARQEHLDGRQS